MASFVLLPQIGVSEESALLTQWHVSTGDAVTAGRLLFTLETDKSTFDIEAETDGVVLALLCDEGDEVEVADPVCVIGQPGESWTLPEGEKKPAGYIKPAGVKAAPLDFVSYASALPAIKARGISPRARRTAERMGIDPGSATPTGPEGRIIERDVRAAYRQSDNGIPMPAEQSPAVPKNRSQYRDIPHSKIRKVIAANMHDSLANLAQLTHHHSFDATALLSLRKRCKESGSEFLENITIGDLVSYATVYTLLRHPQLNALYYDDYQRVFEHVHLGIAVDTQRGLMVPTIRNADLLSVSELSSRIRQAAEDCRGGAVDPSLLKGGTFTLSNLGSFGVEMFTPVINPPQVGILGVCCVTARIKTDGSVYPAMGLSLTYDHRAVDGAPASRFMQELCKNLEGVDLLCLI
ncbi:MAG: 2-oxo acid dehydrogenase subunit E2 [Clostridiales bacterium]|nr:2-oxo acid dehydrogenase subunit E2 [Clostridiales bacterium]